MVKARNMGLDKYERILVVIGEGNELPVNWTMVMTGNAHHYDFGDSAGNIWLSQTKCGDQSYFSVYVTLLTSICRTRNESGTGILPYGGQDTS